MKLRFLGRVYNTFDHSVETVYSEETARFLGKTYTVPRTVFTINAASGIRKKYRGISYGA